MTAGDLNLTAHWSISGAAGTQGFGVGVTGTPADIGGFRGVGSAGVTVGVDQGIGVGEGQMAVGDPGAKKQRLFVL